MNSFGESVRSAGQSTAESAPAPENVPSTTEAFVSVTLPVFVTRNEYVTVSPATSVRLSAVLTIDTDGSGTDGVRVVDGSEVTGVPEGGVPVAVAVFSMEPASTSAC